MTGSKHLLEVAGKKILLDCGFFQGRRAEANQRNREFPPAVVSADTVILSHAHIDHSGSLPSLVKAGFRGPIFATAATVDLAEIMLMDSAHIQEHDSQYLSRKVWPPVKPIYAVGDVIDTIRLFHPKKYGAWFEVVPEVRARFHDAGHILGSAQVEIEAKEAGRTIRLGFTGDLGRKNLPILRDPEQLRDLDVLITESTYANRMHDDISGIAKDLVTVVNSTIAKGGKIVIPAFSVERTQEIVYVLHELFDAGKIHHEVPVYVDSPLSVNATEIFRKHRECYDAETYADFIEKGEGPFTMASLVYVRDASQSRGLNKINTPAIIISASGMCEAGRVLHHLKNNIDDENSTILICGFQAMNTLGRKLVEKMPTVKIFGKEYQRKAQVVTMNAFSGHADQDELFENVKNSGAKKVVCVHGEEHSTKFFAEKIRNDLKIEAIVAKEGETLDLI